MSVSDNLVDSQNLARLVARVDQLTARHYYECALIWELVVALRAHGDHDDLVAKALKHLRQHGGPRMHKQLRKRIA